MMYASWRENMTTSRTIPSILFMTVVVAMLSSPCKAEASLPQATTVRRISDPANPKTYDHLDYDNECYLGDYFRRPYHCPPRRPLHGVPPPPIHYQPPPSPPNDGVLPPPVDEYQPPPPPPTHSARHPGYGCWPPRDPPHHHGQLTARRRSRSTYRSSSTGESQTTTPTTSDKHPLPSTLNHPSAVEPEQSYRYLCPPVCDNYQGRNFQRYCRKSPPPPARADPPVYPPPGIAGC